jgi:hypothetical protein
MNTPNKDSTAQDTSDVDVAPASASPKQEDDGDNESEKEMTTTTMAPENKEDKKISVLFVWRTYRSGLENSFE